MTGVLIRNEKQDRERGKKWRGAEDRRAKRPDAYRQKKGYMRTQQEDGYKP
jgi:hypothetical protein